jgi:hypothetical protein
VLPFPDQKKDTARQHVDDNQPQYPICGFRFQVQLVGQRSKARTQFARVKPKHPQPIKREIQRQPTDTGTLDYIIFTCQQENGYAQF